MIPWDQTEAFKQVCGFDTSHMKIAGQPIGQYGPNADATSFCRVPMWQTLPNSQNKELCITGVKDSAALMWSGFTAAPFTCEPIGQVIALALKDAFIDRMQEVLTLFTPEAVRQGAADSQTLMVEGLMMEVANGGLPGSWTTYGLWSEFIMTMQEDAYRKWYVIVQQELVWRNNA